MTEPFAPLITLVGAPGAACEGDDCVILPIPELESEAVEALGTVRESLTNAPLDGR